MSEATNIRSIPHLALDNWEKDCKSWFEARLPGVPYFFDSSQSWRIDRKVGARVGFSPALKDLQEKDDSFIRVLRCVIVEKWRASKHRNVKSQKPFSPEVPDMFLRVIRSFKNISAHSIFDLQPCHFDEVQNALLKSGSKSNYFFILESLAFFLRQSGVCPYLTWEKDRDAYRSYLKRKKKPGAQLGDAAFNTDQGETDADRRIGALMAVARLTLNKLDDLNVEEQKRALLLTQMDHICTYVMMILMCAPARINEVLCMGTADIKTFKSFGEWEKAPTNHDPNMLGGSNAERLPLYRAHQALFYRDVAFEQLDQNSRSVLLHKGSKGGKWAPKPVLVWMQAVLKECVERVMRTSVKSRKLAEHYQQTPDILYLPTWAEYLRKKEWWTTNEILGVWGDLDKKPSELIASDKVFPGYKNIHVNLFAKRVGVDKRLSSGHDGKKGKKGFEYKGSQVLQAMLKIVQSSFEKAKFVTAEIGISCGVSERLFLTDCSAIQPFAIGSIDYQMLKKRFSQNGELSIFRKLNLQIFQKGVLTMASLGSHDARRFICDHGTKSDISDVLINKWCRRADIRQMDYYEQYDPFERARRAAVYSISNIDRINVEEELSANLQKREELRFNQNTPVWLVVAEHKIQAISVDRVISSSSSPVLAKTASGEPIMLSPVSTGLCSHQHHLSPCQNYDLFCLGCGDHTLVKGHFPTNNKALSIRSLQRKLLIDYIENLIPNLNLGTVDNYDDLVKHLEMIFSFQVSRQCLNSEELANFLIERVEEDILKRINNVALRDLLRKAFISDRIGKFVEDKNFEAGSTITFNDGLHNGSMSLSLIIESSFRRNNPESVKEHLEVKYGKGFLQKITDQEIIHLPYGPDSLESA